MAEAIMERPAPAGEGLTFEKVWAMFEKDREQAQEQAKIDRERYDRDRERFDKEHEQSKKEHEQAKKEHEQAMEKLQKSMEETWRIVKQNSRQMGGLHRSFGEMAEHLVAPGIVKRFNELLKYHFIETASKNQKILDGNGRVLTEIDILLENGEYVIAVEVKARPEIEDIDHHIKRLQILRESRKRRKDERVILGAIAGAIFEDEVKEAVQKAGLYAIVQSGDTMKIDIPEGFVPKEW
jgi:hypothetical protein